MNFDESELADEITNGAWRSVDGRFWELPSRRPAPFEPHRQRELTRIVTALLARAANDDPGVALQAIGALRRRIPELEHEAVALARSHHWSWRDIADLLGLSRSAVHRRYAR